VQVTRAYLPVRGSQIYYEAAGEGEPLLLLHGGFGTVDDFASETPELAKQFKVVAFERPGHGRTADNGEPFSYATMAETTVDFMESLGLKVANLAGWSDGAAVALVVAISRPDLVMRIISVGGFFDTSNLTPGARNWLRSATPESFRKDQPGIVRRYEEVAPEGPAHFPVVFEKTVKMWLNEPNIRREDLAKIRAPALVMAGDRDAAPHEHTLELFRAIKGAQLCIIPGSTHFLLVEKPDAANRAILDFLNDSRKAE